MLKELELYDNQITVIENLSMLVNLEYVLLNASFKVFGPVNFFLGF